MTPNVAIVILNWNNSEDTLACLRSVAGLSYPALFTVVVDNGSADDSVARLRATYPNVDTFETGENLGYAGGNNIGIRYALAHGAQYVCILNNDVTVAPGFLTPLVIELEKNDDVGVVTPLVAEMAEPERVWALGVSVDRRAGSAVRLHAGERVSDWQGAEPYDVDVASGTAMLAKREVFEGAGLLDEPFYLYYEEVDWCLRVRRAGYRILAVPASLVWHKVSATLGESSPVIDYYMLRNHLRLITRHWSGGTGLWLLTRTVVRSLVTVAAYTAKPHGGARVPHRNARLLGLRDAMLGRWGKMGPDVAKACYPEP
jgi:GT2 family glycosyltransferase